MADFLKWTGSYKNRGNAKFKKWLIHNKTLYIKKSPAARKEERTQSWVVSGRWRWQSPGGAGDAVPVELWGEPSTSRGLECWRTALPLSGVRKTPPWRSSKDSFYLPAQWRKKTRSTLRNQNLCLALAAVALWLRGLSASLRTKGSLVWFPVRAHAWVAGQVPRRGWVRGNHIDVSLPFSPSLPLSLKISK